MKNGVDFHRVLDSDGKLIGVLDINNMIPVREDVLQKIELKIGKKDSASSKHYKELMSDQITYIRQHQSSIVKKANKLYKLLKKKNVSRQLKKRCLNWSKLEAVLDRYKRP